MVVVPVNGPIIVDHIAKLNCGFGLVEQGIRSTPVHLEPGTLLSFPGNCDECGTNTEIRPVGMFPTSSTAWLTQ